MIENNEKHELLEHIELGWKDQTYPGDGRLITRPKQPPGGCRDEHDYVAEYFQGKHWKEITLEDLRRNYPGPYDACLAFMSSEAFRFYFPAFMCIAVNYWHTDDVTAGAATDALVPPDMQLASVPEELKGVSDEEQQLHRKFLEHRRKNKDELTAWWQERVSGFTPLQRQTIRRLFIYLTDCYKSKYQGWVPQNLQAALRYWNSGES